MVMLLVPKSAQQETPRDAGPHSILWYPVGSIEGHGKCVVVAFLPGERVVRVVDQPVEQVDERLRLRAGDAVVEVEGDAATNTRAFKGGAGGPRVWVLGSKCCWGQVCL